MSLEKFHQILTKHIEKMHRSSIWSTSNNSTILNIRNKGLKPSGNLNNYSVPVSLLKKIGYETNPGKILQPQSSAGCILHLRQKLEC